MNTREKNAKLLLDLDCIGAISDEDAALKALQSPREKIVSQLNADVGTSESETQPQGCSQDDQLDPPRQSQLVGARLSPQHTTSSSTSILSLLLPTQSLPPSSPEEQQKSLQTQQLAIIDMRIAGVQEDKKNREEVNKVRKVVIITTAVLVTVGLIVATHGTIVPALIVVAAIIALCKLMECTSKHEDEIAKESKEKRSPLIIHSILHSSSSTPPTSPTNSSIINRKAVCS